MLNLHDNLLNKQQCLFKDVMMTNKYNCNSQNMFNTAKPISALQITNRAYVATAQARSQMDTSNVFNAMIKDVLPLNNEKQMNKYQKINGVYTSTRYQQPNNIQQLQSNKNQMLSFTNLNQRTQIYKTPKNQQLSACSFQVSGDLGYSIRDQYQDQSFQTVDIKRKAKARSQVSRSSTIQMQVYDGFYDFESEKHEKSENGLLGPQPEHCKGKKTLVLDLDETLIYAYTFYEEYEKCYVESGIYDNPLAFQLNKDWVHKRPGLDEFLKTLSQYYELVIFTAGLAHYANPVIDKIDPNGYITMRLFRHDMNNGGKKLSNIGRPAKDAIIIDDKDYNFIDNPEQAIPINAYYGFENNPDDTKLLDLIPLLIQLSKINDCRDVIKQFMKIEERSSWRYDNLGNLIEINKAMKECDKILNNK